MTPETVNLIDRISNFWHGLPKEVRVAIYVVVSYFLALAVKYLTSIETANELLAIVINLLIVVIEQIIARIKKIQELRTRLMENGMNPDKEE